MTRNSTNGRPERVAPWPVRAWFRTLARVAPSLAERKAAELFITPRLRKTSSPTALHTSLLPERAMQRRAGEAEPAYPALPTGRIALWSWGRGPTALLVHGWSGSAGDMAHLAAPLVQAGYRTVLFDMPGHGESAPAKSNLYVYLQTLTALGQLVGPIDTVIGHSLGATATAIALGDGLLRAERAVLLAPGISPWAFAGQFAKMVGLPEERVPGMVSHTEALVGRAADTLNAAYSVRQLQIPGYFIHDPEDIDVPFEHSAAIVEAWPNAMLVARRGLGHRKILKDPATIAAAVEFVKGSIPGA